MQIENKIIKFIPSHCNNISISCAISMAMAVEGNGENDSWWCWQLSKYVMSFHPHAFVFKMNPLLMELESGGGFYVFDDIFVYHFGSKKLRGDDVWMFGCSNSQEPLKVSNFDKTKSNFESLPLKPTAESNARVLYYPSHPKKLKLHMRTFSLFLHWKHVYIRCEHVHPPYT